MQSDQVENIFKVDKINGRSWQTCFGGDMPYSIKKIYVNRQNMTNL